MPARAGSSLAVRMAAGYALSAFALVSLVSAALYRDFKRGLRAEADEFVVDNVAVIAGLLQERPVDEDALLREVVWEWANRRHARVYVRMVQGPLAPAETEGMSEVLPSSVFPPAPADGRAPLLLVDHEGEGGRLYRLAAARVDAGADAPAAVIHVALDRADDALLLAQHRAHLLTVLGVALAASGLVGYVVARHGMRPVRRMARTVSGIRPATLGQRLDPAELPSELAALATNVNAMLGRLEDAFARLTRFSGDLAHELRTPVQNLRGEVEVALGRERAPAEYRAVLSSALEECVRLSELIDRLLFLARAEDPRTQIRREEVDLVRELESVREFYEPSAAEKGVSLRVSAHGARASVDRVLLQRAVGNLLANALAHTPRGGEVTLDAQRSGDAVVVRVSDTGAGIPPDAQPHVFDRFYRADSARAGSTPGAGLGLAIVRSVVQLHGGTVSLESAPGKGTVVTMTLPAGPP